VIVALPPSSTPLWLQVLVVIAGPFTGIITAIAVTYLTQKSTAKNARERAVFEREEAIRKEGISATEATRLEHLRREIEALESFARSMIGMTSELAECINAAISGERESWNRAYNNETSFREATAMEAMYFSGRLDPEWGVYRLAYRAAWRDATALAAAWALASDNLPNPENLDLDTRIAQAHAAADQSLASQTALIEPQDALRTKISAFARQLRVAGAP
jgi:hypothetical protein